MIYFFGILVFIFGLLIGSFLNCVIYRLSLPNFSLKNLAGLKKRSYCPNCKHKLSWYELIPVLSFIFLKAKCRYCQKLISWQYPLVEIATGLLFLLIFTQFSILNFSDFLNFIFLIIVSCFLVVIFVFDLKHYIIPNKVIYPLIILIIVYRIFIHNSSFLNYLLTAFLAAGFFLLIIIFSRGKAMGMGDVKLVFFMGFFLGFPNILVALFFSFLIGAIIGIGLVFLKKKGFKSEIPFGPFLATGTIIGLFWAGQLIDLYLSLFQNN